jgi:hypothetical protein
VYSNYVKIYNIPDSPASPYHNWMHNFPSYCLIDQNWNIEHGREREFPRHNLYVPEYCYNCFPVDWYWPSHPIKEHGITSFFPLCSKYGGNKINSLPTFTSYFYFRVVSNGCFMASWLMTSIWRFLLFITTILNPGLVRLNIPSKNFMNIRG